MFDKCQLKKNNIINVNSDIFKNAEKILVST